MLLRLNAVTRFLRRGRVPAPRVRMRIEEVEARILHSADPLPGVSDLAGAQLHVRVLEPAPAPVREDTVAEIARVRELVIVDSATAGYEALVEDIVAHAGRERGIAVLVLGAEEDGIARVSEALASHEGLDAIHIVSHGSAGRIQLGGESLDAATLSARAAEISVWSKALSAEADVLIYGCDVAASDEGQLLVQRIADLTGADVAASEDLTGDRAQGGDWDLEFRIGAIESDIAMSASVQESWQGTLAAPVLNGANDLTGISEDPATNDGTSIAALLVGQVTDADANALRGIAVTAVVDTNGVWEYTTDARATWNAFGGATSATARLLADDGNTFVRFVPNANWNGTVTSGLTFRAWDQTSGVNGGTADTTQRSLDVRDDFNDPGYGNSYGSASWNGAWVDSDGNAGGGQIYNSGTALVMNGGLLTTSTIERAVNLQYANSAQLTFNYNNTIGLGSVKLEAFANGSWSTLSNNVWSAGADTASFGITAAADTRIRFTVTGVLSGGNFTVDNLKIAYVKPLNGGDTAFSSATHASDITVASVNDAPVGADATVVATEDTAYTFRLANFTFSDPGDTPQHTLSGVKIVSLPGAGTLMLNGAAVGVNQVVSAADIAASKLTFMAGTDANGAGYASFTFQVEDSGGALDATPRTMTIDVTAVADAPRLTGANNLVSIAEQDVNSAGTLVSALLAGGHVTDPDAGALTGIAVTGVDNTNGVWQYSTNAGSTWLAFGNPSEGTARLLAADAQVRFVPSGTWTGTVSNGLTFRAWDRTVGANGGVAPTVANPVLRDDFNSVSYSRQDGTARWSGDWVDSEGDPTGGKIHANGTALELKPNGTGVWIYREANLTGVTAATLAFDYTNNITSGAQIVLEVSGDGGATYTLLETFSSANSGSRLYTRDISGYISAATRIRFTISVADSPPRELQIDSLRIDMTAPGNGGTAAFSTALASSSVSVVPVNDAPRGTDSTVQINEDEPLVLTAAHFGFSDPDDSPAHTLHSVKISSLPNAGVLKLDGVAVTVNQLISAADIAANKLVYTPVADANGTGYASFTFQVKDTGGTTLGGVDVDPTPRTLTIDVLAVNDAPSGTSKTVIAAEDTPLVITAADFGFGDAADGHVLHSVKISSLPVNGVLMLDGVAVMLNQLISAADLAANKLKFVPAADANGAGYASFTFQVKDTGGAAPGIDLDPTPRTITIDVTAVNDAPSGVSKTVIATEDTPLVLTTADFGFGDAADGHALHSVKISSLPTAGVLKLDGVIVTLNQLISAADLAANKLTFVAAADANGAGYATFTFQVKDTGGTPGADLDATPRTMTIDVAPVNDAPSGTSKTVTATEDTPLVLTAADFGFGDTADGHALHSVKIASLPAAGVLKLDGVAVTLNQVISAADIAANKLTFVPAADGSGTGYASFTFQVKDTGGIAPGIDLDPTPRTLTIDVSPVNNAPSGTSKTVTATEDTPLVLTTADFGFADTVDGHTLHSVKIASLPAAGMLMLDGVAVTLNQFISAADIAANKLTFVAAANANGAGYASFTFQVKDTGGTAAGGIDVDPTARTLTIDVTAVNDAPSGTSKTLTAMEDKPLVITIADFGFGDAAEGHALHSVKISSLPMAGVLKLDGVAVTLNQLISAADLAANKLTFVSAADANGAGYASFTFQVKDTGGIAAGGVDLDPVARTLTIDVTAVNDAPRGANATVATTEDVAFVFTTAHFGFGDSADGHGLQAVKIASVPAAGMLTLNGVAVRDGDAVSAVDIAAGRLAFAPAADANGTGYASFTFRVQDTGGTASGGFDLDPIARTLTIDVASVNDAPAGANNAVTTDEDVTFAFGIAAFGMTDAHDTPANTLQAVVISAVPRSGTLALDGVAVSAGQTIAAADIAAGKLTFRAAPDANGAAYARFTFHVQDDGGGADLDAVARVMTIHVTAVEDVVVKPPEEPKMEPPVVVVSAPSVIADVGVRKTETEAAPAAPAEKQLTAPAAAQETTTSASSSEAAAGEPGGGESGGGDAGGGGSATDGQQGIAIGATSDGGGVRIVQGGAQRLDGQQQQVRDLRGPTGAPTASDGPAQQQQQQQAISFAGDRQSDQAVLLAAGHSRASDGALLGTAESRSTTQQLDQMREDLKGEGQLEARAIAATAATGLGLSVGYVIWVLRGGVLLSALMTSVPAWRFVDPLPVLGHMDADGDGEGDDATDDSLESMVTRNADAHAADTDERAADAKTETA